MSLVSADQRVNMILTNMIPVRNIREDSEADREDLQNSIRWLHQEDPDLAQLKETLPFSRNDGFQRAITQREKFKQIDPEGYAADCRRKKQILAWHVRDMDPECIHLSKEQFDALCPRDPPTPPVSIPVPAGGDLGGGRRTFFQSVSGIWARNGKYGPIAQRRSYGTASRSPSPSVVPEELQTEADKAELTRRKRRRLE